jgi:surfeit locus 1 family protein
MTSSDGRRFPVGLTVAVAIALAVLCALGTWQLQRRVWKEHLLARVAAAKAAPARPLADVLAAAARGEDVEFTRVRADCPGLAAAPYAELYALTDGRTGWRLMSVCRRTGGPAMLVDRGFVAEAVSARPAVDAASTAPATVVGVLRRPDRANPFTPEHRPGGRWFARELPAMGRELGAPRVSSYFLAAETSSNPDWPALEPRPLPTDIPNRHLEYALTWFGLALALLGVYVAAVVRRPRPDAR